MKNKTKNKLIYSCAQLIGTGLILTFAVVISFELYKNGYEGKVFTNNYTTSVLYSDSLSNASGAAPWAILSLNWFLCRSMIKRWFSFLKKRFS